MSGFDNSVLFVTKSSPGQMARFQYNASGTLDFSIYNNSGTPEGSVSAQVGSICSDTTNGVIYIKETGSGNTGWATFPSSSGSFTDERVLRADGTNGIQDSGVTLDDSDQMTGLAQVESTSFNTADAADGITISSNIIVTEGTNTDIDLELQGKGNGAVQVDRLKANYDETTNFITVNGAVQTADIIAGDSSGADFIEFLANSQGNVATVGGIIVGARARDSAGSRIVVQDNDTLFDLYSCGFDGTDFSTSSRIEMAVDDTPGNNQMPGRIVFYTSPSASQTLTEALRIDSSQAITVSDAYTLPTSDGSSGEALVTDGSGNISFQAVALFSWSVETGASAGLTSNTGVFANNGSGVTLTLPATASVGDTFQIVAMDAAGFVIAQNAGQTIQVGDTATTTGAGGSITSTSIGDWIEIVCNVANTGFHANVKQGNLTIV